MKAKHPDILPPSEKMRKPTPKTGYEQFQKWRRQKFPVREKCIIVLKFPWGGIKLAVVLTRWSLVWVMTLPRGNPTLTVFVQYRVKFVNCGRRVVYSRLFTTIPVCSWIRHCRSSCQRNFWQTPIPDVSGAWTHLLRNLSLSYLVNQERGIKNGQ